MKVLRAAPLGLLGWMDTKPRVAPILAELALAPPRAGIGSSLRDCKKRLDSVEKIRKMVLIPAEEAWLYKNPDAINSVRKGCSLSRA